MTKNIFDDQLQERLGQVLCDLVSINSVFTNPQGIEKALHYCEQELAARLPAFLSHRDSAGNLISISNHFDRSKNAVLLSAHVDTVGADASEWKSSRLPFQAIETDTHIIGRGANDCKAGVAMMLMAATLARELPLDNVVFLFSYREEGNCGKTSTRIGEELGKSIPLSDKGNLLLCLENTVSLTESGPLLSAYDHEPCNAFISIEGHLEQIRAFLLARPEWRPVAIRPSSVTWHGGEGCLVTGVSGHAATIANADNVLFAAIMDETCGIIDGGNEEQASIVDNKVKIRTSAVPTTHVAVLNYRGLTAIDDLRKSLAQINYQERFPFEHAAGSDRRQAFRDSLARRLMGELSRRWLPVEFDRNPGRSDASAIWNAASERDRVEIITMGPGTRSHFDNGIFRRTHGPDEGFHKQSGNVAIGFILDLISRYLVE